MEEKGCCGEEGGQNSHVDSLGWNYEKIACRKGERVIDEEVYNSFRVEGGEVKWLEMSVRGVQPRMTELFLRRFYK